MSHLIMCASTIAKVYIHLMPILISHWDVCLRAPSRLSRQNESTYVNREWVIVLWRTTISKIPQVFDWVASDDGNMTSEQSVWSSSSFVFARAAGWQSQQDHWSSIWVQDMKLIQVYARRTRLIRIPRTSWGLFAICCCCVACFLLRIKWVTSTAYRLVW